MFEQMRGMKPREKLQYYVEYYGWRTLGIAAVLGIIIFLVVHFATSKTIVTGVLAVNARGTQKVAVNADYFDAFLERNGHDSGKESVLLNCNTYVSTDYQDSVNRTNIQSVQTMFMTQSVDVFLADEEFFRAIAQSDYLADLSTCIPEEVLSVHEDDLIYEINQNTGQEMLAGIRVYPEQPWMKAVGWYEEPAVIGLAQEMKNKELAVALFLEALEE